MELKEMSMKELLALHNSLADSPAGPKTFSTKGKLIDRIEALRAVVPRAAPGASAAEAQPKQQADSTEAVAPPQDTKKRGLGVGELARAILMDPAGYPHSLIAAMVNARIEGATATDKSVRWYAAKMRTDGLQVPERAKTFPTEMDEAQSKEWLRSVVIVKGAAK